MKTLVGSTALAQYIPDLREPKDVDYYAETKTPGEDSLWHPNFDKWEWSGDVASLDELYTIKVSHSFWELKNGTWKKHMFDIQKMKDAGAQFIPELHKVLYPAWVDMHGVKKANLEQAPDAFFNPNVQRMYDHDSVHASIAYYDEPLFNRILRDNHEVAVDKSKFDALSTEDKNRLVREEVYATALERRLIPVNYKMHPRVAYDYALKKLITSFSKGWFPLYVVLNFADLNKPDVDFVQRHKDNAHKLILL